MGSQIKQLFLWLIEKEFHCTSCGTDYSIYETPLVLRVDIPDVKGEFHSNRNRGKIYVLWPGESRRGVAGWIWPSCRQLWTLRHFSAHLRDTGCSLIFDGVQLSAPPPPSSVIGGAFILWDINKVRSGSDRRCNFLMRQPLKCANNMIGGAISLWDSRQSAPIIWKGVQYHYQ